MLVSAQCWMCQCTWLITSVSVHTTTGWQQKSDLHSGFNRKSNDWTLTQTKTSNEYKLHASSLRCQVHTTNMLKMLSWCIWRLWQMKFWTTKTPEVKIFWNVDTLQTLQVLIFFFFPHITKRDVQAPTFSFAVLLRNNMRTCMTYPW